MIFLSPLVQFQMYYKGSAWPLVKFYMLKWNNEIHNLMFSSFSEAGFLALWGKTTDCQAGNIIITGRFYHALWTWNHLPKDLRLNLFKYLFVFIRTRVRPVNVFFVCFFSLERLLMFYVRSICIYCCRSCILLCFCSIFWDVLLLCSHYLAQ